MQQTSQETKVATTEAPAVEGKQDLYQKITSLIVEALEKGTPPWRRPWNAEHAAGRIERPLRHNGEPYRGINILVLWLTAEAKGYSAPYWLSFQQAKEEGGNVRKGEKGTTVVFASKFSKDVEGEEQEFFCYKQYTVFNAEQCDNLPEKFTKLKASTKREPLQVIETADKFFKATGADIRNGGTKAVYSQEGDYIQIPHLQTFESSLAHAATVAHELIHWTKHPKRLARDTNRKQWGDEGYAMEELVAEIGSAFLCAELDLVPQIEDSAAYVASWLKVLKGDKKAIFTASAMSQKAVDFLKGEKGKGEFEEKKGKE